MSTTWPNGSESRFGSRIFRAWRECTTGPQSRLSSYLPCVLRDGAPSPVPTNSDTTAMETEQGVDQLVEKTRRSEFDAKEFAANCFAGALLMPRMALHRAFALREWDIQECTPGQIYTVSNYFGVGYSTLVQHMHSGLRLLPDAHAAALLKVSPRKAQALALGWESQHIVWIVDQHWTGRAIDVEMPDLVFVQGQPTFEGDCLAQVQDVRDGRLFSARQPGIGKFCNGGGWSAFVRVSRRAFAGRSIFRHLEEGDDEGSYDN